MLMRTIEFGWNSGNDHYAEIEELSASIESLLPNNEADGSSVYDHRIRAELRELDPQIPDWHMTVSSSQVDELLGQITGFMLSVGRRFTSFKATVFVTRDEDLGSRIDGTTIQNGAITYFTLHEGTYFDDTYRVVSQEPSVVSEPSPLDVIPETVYERLFSGLQPRGHCWWNEGF